MRPLFLRNFLSFGQTTLPSGSLTSTVAFCWNKRSEVVFLNDFEYDAKAKDWMPWSYFKNFLEGGNVKVARAKNRGGNQLFEGTAPPRVGAWRATVHRCLFREGLDSRPARCRHGAQRSTR